MPTHTSIGMGGTDDAVEVKQYLPLRELVSKFIEQERNKRNPFSDAVLNAFEMVARRIHELGHNQIFVEKDFFTNSVALEDTLPSETMSKLVGRYLYYLRNANRLRVHPSIDGPQFAIYQLL